MRSNSQMLFIVSLLVVSIAVTSVPAASATAKVGKIILNPTHAVPGTLVTFEGVGWDLQPGETVCLVNGEAVKMDSHAVCEVVFRHGPYEPVGTFIVKDVPPGNYPVVLYVEFGDARALVTLTGEQEFTVDAVATVTTVATTTTIPELPLPVLVLLLSVIVTYAIARRRNQGLRTSSLIQQRFHVGLADGMGAVVIEARLKKTSRFIGVEASRHSDQRQ